MKKYRIVNIGMMMTSTFIFSQDVSVPSSSVEELIQSAQAQLQTSASKPVSLVPPVDTMQETRASNQIAPTPQQALAVTSDVEVPTSDTQVELTPIQMPDTQTQVEALPEPSPARDTAQDASGFVTQDTATQQPFADGAVLESAVPIAPDSISVPSLVSADQQPIVDSLVPETEVPVAPDIISVTPEDQAIQQKAEEQTLQDSLLDTINVDDNVNWLEVRESMEDMVDQIELINKLFVQVLDIRMEYLKQRNQVDKEFDMFNNQIGMNIGSLSEIIGSISDDLEQDRLEDGDLNIQEREFLTKVKDQKNTLDQIIANVKSLIEADASIDDIIMAVEAQTNQARTYQNQAWQNFQTIKSTPQKAKELLAKTTSLYDNVQSIYSQYLKGQLFQYFSQTVQDLKRQMTQVETDVNALMQVGINIKNQARVIEKIDQKEDQARREKETNTLQDKLDACQRTQSIGLFGTIKGWFGW